MFSSIPSWSAITWSFIIQFYNYPCASLLSKLPFPQLLMSGPNSTPSAQAQVYLGEWTDICGAAKHRYSHPPFGRGPWLQAFIARKKMLIIRKNHRKRGKLHKPVTWLVTTYGTDISRKSFYLEQIRSTLHFSGINHCLPYRSCICGAKGSFGIVMPTMWLQVKIKHI